MTRVEGDLVVPDKSRSIVIPNGGISARRNLLSQGAAWNRRGQQIPPVSLRSGVGMTRVEGDLVIPDKSRSVVIPNGGISVRRNLLSQGAAWNRRGQQIPPLSLRSGVGMTRVALRFKRKSPRLAKTWGTLLYSFLFLDFCAALKRRSSTNSLTSPRSTPPNILPAPASACRF